MDMKKKIYNTVEATLKDAELHYSVEDDIIFCLGISGEHASFDIKLVCEENMELLLAVVKCGIRIPKDKIGKMCRWIVEKNYSLSVGEFKMDTSDGELSFRMACPLDGGAVNKDIVRVALAQTLNTFDNTYEEMVKAMYLEGDENEDWVLKMAQDTAKQVKEAGDGLESGTNKSLNS